MTRRHSHPRCNLLLRGLLVVPVIAWACACARLPPLPPPANKPITEWWVDTPELKATDLCHLEGPARIKAGEPLVLRIHLTRPPSAEIYTFWLTAIDTPFRGVSADIFDVRRDGTPVSYRGEKPTESLIPRDWSHPKYPNFDACPTRGCILHEDSYVTIHPAEPITAQFDLAVAYAVDRPGTYSIAWKGLIHDVRIPEHRPFYEYSDASGTASPHKRQLHPVHMACTPIAVTVVAP